MCTVLVSLVLERTKGTREVLTGTTLPVFGQDLAVSVPMSNPPFQHPLFAGPFVHEAWTIRLARDCEDGDPAIDRDVTAKASARNDAGAENNILRRIRVQGGLIREQSGSKNKRRICIQESPAPVNNRLQSAADL